MVKNGLEIVTKRERDLHFSRCLLFILSHVCFGKLNRRVMRHTGPFLVRCYIEG